MFIALKPRARRKRASGSAGFSSTAREPQVVADCRSPFSIEARLAPKAAAKSEGSFWKAAA